jgi:hypothetical protein
MSDWETVRLGVRPRPKTFTKAGANRANERLVGMGLKKGLKDVHLDRRVDLEEVRVISNGSANSRVRGFGKGWTRKWLSSFRPFCSSWR